MHSVKHEAKCVSVAREKHSNRALFMWTRNCFSRFKTHPSVDNFCRVQLTPYIHKTSRQPKITQSSRERREIEKQTEHFETICRSNRGIIYTFLQTHREKQRKGKRERKILSIFLYYLDDKIARFKKIKKIKIKIQFISHLQNLVSIDGSSKIKYTRRH